MGFRKINVEEEINRCIENNPEVEKSLKEAEAEYEFIKLLVRKRKELGLSQKEISEKSGLTQQMISRIETFDSLPTLKTLFKYIDSMELEITIKEKAKVC